MAAQSLMTIARAYGVETHWIAGALVVSQEIKEALKIPEEYDLAFFAVLGYPSEEIVQKFPQLHDVCYAETLNRPFQVED